MTGIAPYRYLRKTVHQLRPSGRIGRLRDIRGDPGKVVCRLVILEAHLAKLGRHVTSESLTLTDRHHLAHALKTPIAVIRNEASSLPDDKGSILKAEADRMTRVVEHHLLDARAQMRQRRVPAGAPLDRVMEDVRFSLERLYPERKVEFRVPSGLAAACTEDDCGEMIGNLADNACKWAASTVRISARRSAERILIQVDDDGAGLNEEERTHVLTRGGRLDESMPGHGLGLCIVLKLAAIHGGALRLERSEHGGLAAFLDLPAAR